MTKIMIMTKTAIDNYFEKLCYNMKSLLVSNNYSYFLSNIESLKWYKNAHDFPQEILKKYKKLFLAQELRRTAFQAEIASLNSIDVDFIGIKGIFFEQLYYTQQSRLYGDIDIYIKKKDTMRIYSQLKHQGFKLKKEKNKLKNATFLYNNPLLLRIFGSNYLNGIHAIDMEKEDNHVLFEIHSNLNVNSRLHFNQKLIWKNAKKIVLENGLSFFNMEKYDYSLYLINHLVNHLGYINFCNTKFDINLQNLYDIFILFEINNYDFNVLFEKAQKYNLLDETIFVIHFYNYIMNKNINIKHYHMKKEIYIELCKISVPKLIVGDFSDTLLEELGELNVRALLCQGQTNRNIFMNRNIKKMLRRKRSAY